MKSRLNRVASLLLAIALMASSAYADEGQNSVSSRNWIYSVTLGIAEWQDLAELDCSDSSSICIELNDPFNSNAVGGYVGVTAGLGKWFTTGLKVDYADFDSVRNISGVSESLRGPIYILSAGGTFGR